MKDRMERLVVLPFSVGCVSESSIAVGAIQPRRPKEIIPRFTGEGEDESVSGDKMKNTFGFLPIPRSNISTGLQRLIKSIKSFSQFFVFKEEDADEMEMELEIGNPTDVRHVTHIGWDGSATTTTSSKGWDDFKPDDLFSLPASIALKQYELDMADQADPPLVNASTATRA